MGLLQDRVAIVTGASGGVGRGICTAFAREGARVVVIDTDEYAATNVATELESFGAQAVAIPCDIRDPDAITRAVTEAVDWFGTVDILVNNTSHLMRDVALEDMTDEDFEVALAIGPAATFRFMRACHRYLSGDGHVINVRSETEVAVVPEAAVEEWNWYAITVNRLSPGELADAEVGRVAVFLAGPDATFVDDCTVTAEGDGALVA
jgi:NAD(P)-dependent dehydrogenase (short-subunit alcohol dehydrogenase family)